MFIAGMLDVSRRTYSETLADAHELCEQLGEKYELSDLCLQHSGSRGWHLILRNTKKSTEELPECFEQVHKYVLEHELSHHQTTQHTTVP
eukprot:m.282513 g.282513  ORF g.282513 m.282513 type:complete len:90 (+) comp15755_c0_seq43:1743-2012(+)